ncbi:TolC family protein [Pseudanabaena galeata UHCC 0370]|jgi:outer membrane protein TolC|uniref:TolC family protein n=1 Tax=Pseudanabaena galeata UHCC 0370 TaxID=3110310 RepID=A0ABU5TP96_9CYAN|nr:TolC family protein [Pseudanabaena galeata]MEA5480099.1 TolC family protein [Pseudanabaena galeata UHCC 0370]
MLQRMIWAAFALGICTNLWVSSSYAQEKTAPQPIDSQPNPSQEKDAQEPPLENPADLLRPTKAEEVEPKNITSFTLQEAIDLRLAKNRQVQAAKLRVEQAKAAIREAEAALQPTAALQISLSRDLSASNQLAIETTRRAALLQNADPSSVEFQQIQNYITTTLSPTLSLSYGLYQPQRSPLIESAYKSLQLNELEVERLSQQIRLEITNAYYAIQRADQQVLIEEASVRQSEMSVYNAEELLKGQLGTRFDVLTSQVQLDDATQRLIRAISQQQAVSRRFVRLLDLSPTVIPKASEPIKQGKAWELSLEDSILLGLQQRIDLTQQEINRQISLKRAEFEEASLQPQVNLFANLSGLSLSTEDPRDPSNFSYGTAAGYSIGLTLQWRLLDGGSAAAKADQQRINAAIATNQFADIKAQVRLEIEEAYFSLKANEKNIVIAEKALSRAEQNLELARLRFQAGVGLQTEVNIAETSLTQARGNVLQAIIGYNQDLASLHRAVGNSTKPEEI